MAMRTSTRQLLPMTLPLALALSLALALTLATPAGADSTPSPTPSPATDPLKIAHEQYKKERELYFLAIREREISMREINFAFKIAVDKANSDARIVLWAATTPERKSAAANARRSAIAAAIIERDAAITALGPIPIAPVSPQKAMKLQQEGKGKRGSK